MQFYPADWLQDTRCLTKETRGVWIDLICQMWIAPERGRLEWTQRQFESFVGAETDPQMATAIWNELIHSNVGNFEIKDAIYMIECRRMIREETKRNREARKKYRQRHGDVPPDVPQESPGIYQKSEVRSHKDPPDPPSAKEPAQPDGFAEFWDLYPKKKSKGDAEKAWHKIRPDAELQNSIMAGIKRAKSSHDWLKQSGQFIPYPGTWLRAKGWEDRPVSYSAPKQQGSFLQMKNEPKPSDEDIEKSRSFLNETISKLSGKLGGK